MTLLGAEQVQSAASRMSSAADTMSSAAGSIDSSVEQFRRTWCDVEGELRALRESLDTLTAELKEQRTLREFHRIDPEHAGDQD